MAQPLQQVCQQLQQLVQQADSQSVQEGATDPMYDITLEQLESLAAGVELASQKLLKEQDVFSSSTDLSTYTAGELNKMAADVREASRKLAIVLAAGSNQFQNQTQGDMETISTLHSYIAPDVSKNIDVPMMQRVVSEGNELCAHRRQRSTCPYGCASFCAHGEHRHTCHTCSSKHGITMSSNDFAQGENSASTMKKLAKLFSELSKHCEKVSSDRSQSKAQKKQKEAIKGKLTKKAKTLVPMIRGHVLRIGIAKGQHLNISSGCANVSTITQMFSYQAVEDAHRQLEDGRDRIMQELTIRKLEAKMSKNSPEKART